MPLVGFLQSSFLLRSPPQNSNAFLRSHPPRRAHLSPRTLPLAQLPANSDPSQSPPPSDPAAPILESPDASARTATLEHPAPASAGAAKKQAPAQVRERAWEALDRLLAEKRVEFKARVRKPGDRTIDPVGDLYPADTKDEAIRLFGHEEREIRVNFFRDPDYWCPDCQAVQLQLEAKGIPYRIRLINMRDKGKQAAYFLRLRDTGILPTIQLDLSSVVQEAGKVRAAIEAQFPDYYPLLPPKRTEELEDAKRIFEVERVLYRAWFGFLFRSEKDWPQGQERFVEALKKWTQILVQQGGGGPFVLGEEMSLLDVYAAPLFERYIASALYFKGFKIRGDPAYAPVHQWLLAMERQFPQYAATTPDYYSIVRDIPIHYGQPLPSELGTPFQKFIDGDDQHWELPLPPLNSSAIEPRGSLRPGDQGDHGRHRVEASGHILTNMKNMTIMLTNRALRVTSTGRQKRQIIAPFQINEEISVQLDEALRLLSRALLVGVDELEPERLEGYPLPRQIGDPIVVAFCAMRNSVRVPRDMSFPAARQFRAHVSWVCQVIVGSERWAV
eukprot:CAMPEP_0184724868 /NCGR_PEP_ID=MMETSP0314-20130426/29208_1 /TAXON_ID=38298 /ORGANISM="Rhodella maculata, Strain CCMP 736" /LENGTH=557 /DNA_ID=CAMNT_0027189955 /DNA_START=61 /DNA_END=1730 /DNA_ORIENTATION=-